jgi:hypothetical protein
MRCLFLAIMLVSSLCVAQTAQPAATAQELKFLRFILLNVASLDHSSDAKANYEGSLVVHFGLSSQESTAIHSAGQTLNAILAQLRQQTTALLAGKIILTSADTAALASINAQREQEIATLANQVLNSVSSTTAVRLRAPGNVMAATITATAK